MNQYFQIYFIIKQFFMYAIDNYQIQLYIITWINEGGILFDFNADKLQEKINFKAIKYILPIPQVERSVYYFFHQPKDKQNKHSIILQRRKQQTSEIQSSNKKCQDFMLLGGVKIWTEFKGRQNKFYYVYMTPISARDILLIQSSNQKYQYQQKQKSMPYLIIRSFQRGYPLKKDQLIKLGKTEFKIFDIQDNTKECEYETDEIMNLDQKIEESKMEYENRKSDQQKLCRVCYDSQDFFDNPLINPCNCKGSTKNIHVNCLKEWINLKLKKMKNQGSGQMYHPKQNFCQICKKKFPKLILKNGVKHSLFSFLQDDNPLIALISINEELKQILTDPLKIQNNAIAGQNIIYITVGEDKKATIGRMIDNGIILQDFSVSRKHAQLELDKKRGFKIYDSKSKYGTLLYEPQAKIKLHFSERAFEINSTCFSLKIQSKSN